MVQYDESNLDYNDLKHEKSNINKKINIEILSNNNRIIEEENDYTTDEIISPESIFDNNEADTLLKYDESHQDDNKFNESFHFSFRECDGTYTCTYRYGELLTICHSRSYHGTVALA